MDNEKMIYITLNMFTRNQDIIFVDTLGKLQYIASASYEQLSETILNFSVTKCIENIYIDGNPVFAEKLIYDLKHNLKTNYSNMNVRIYLNGEICN